jgi:hypothetical protein
MLVNDVALGAQRQRHTPARAYQPASDSNPDRFPMPLKERSVSSNVGQNCRSRSESKDERAAEIDPLLRERECLADGLKAETVPLDADERRWVWKCPTPGYPGPLHGVGFSAEKGTVFVVGPCGRTFLS